MQTIGSENSPLLGEAHNDRRSGSDAENHHVCSIHAQGKKWMWTLTGTISLSIMIWHRPRCYAAIGWQFLLLTSTFSLNKLRLWWCICWQLYMLKLRKVPSLVNRVYLVPPVIAGIRPAKTGRLIRRCRCFHSIYIQGVHLDFLLTKRLAERNTILSA